MFKDISYGGMPVIRNDLTGESAVSFIGAKITLKSAYRRAADRIIIANIPRVCRRDSVSPLYQLGQLKYTYNDMQEH